MNTPILKPKAILAEELIGFNPSDVLPKRMPTEESKIRKMSAALKQIEKEESSEEQIKEWKRLGIKKPTYISDQEWDSSDLQLDAKENMIAYMTAWGMRPVEIERGLGIGTDTGYLRNLNKSETFKNLVKEIQQKIFGQDPQKAIRSLIPKAIGRISETIDDEQAKASTRLAAAQDILDRSLGRATQNIKVEETSLKKVFETLDMIKKSGNLEDIIIEGSVVDGSEIKENPKVEVEENLDTVDLWMKENLP